MTEKLLLVMGVTTLCMLSPGPDMILVMRNTLTASRRSGGLTALGVLTGNMVHIAYCTLGIARLLTRSPTAFNVLRIASAIYLAYLGVQSLRSANTTKAPSNASSGSVSAVFWIVFVQTLHLPMIRSGLARSTLAIDRVFGVVLILFGARVALLK